ncbi:hypothetical protein [Flintibacter sp.]
MTFNSSGTTARNNYVHYSFQEGITIEVFQNFPTIENSTISGQAY